MKQFFLMCIFTLNSTNIFACDDSEILQRLQQQEEGKLLENAPTFRHAWEDKVISLVFSESQADGDHCVAKMTLALPKEDIDQVIEYLDVNPAKRILLAAQGYGAPVETTTVDFFYKADGTSMNEKNQALNKLHSNVEFAYQSLAQERVVFAKDTSNSMAWNQIKLDMETENCKKLITTEVNQTNVSCSCRIKKLSKVLSPREMELVNFINSQPFSTATGVLNNYKEIRTNIDSACNA